MKLSKRLRAKELLKSSSPKAYGELAESNSLIWFLTQETRGAVFIGSVRSASALLYQATRQPWGTGSLVDTLVVRYSGWWYWWRASRLSLSSPLKIRDGKHAKNSLFLCSLVTRA